MGSGGCEKYKIINESNFEMVAQHFCCGPIICCRNIFPLRGYNKTLPRTPLGLLFENAFPAFFSTFEPFSSASLMSLGRFYCFQSRPWLLRT